MIQCEYLFLPEVQYLYFKREFLNGQFLTHSALLIRVGNYTSKPLYLMSCATEVGGHFPFPSSLCPTLIKINSFVFPAEKPFHVVWLKTKSTIPPHYQTWPHVTQSSQSEYIYIVLLGTEIRSLKVLPRTYPPQTCCGRQNNSPPNISIFQSPEPVVILHGKRDFADGIKLKVLR